MQGNLDQVFKSLPRLYQAHQIFSWKTVSSFVPRTKMKSSEDEENKYVLSYEIKNM